MTTTTFSTTATPSVPRPLSTLSTLSMLPSTPMPTGTLTGISTWRERVTHVDATTVVTDAGSATTHHNSIATAAAAVRGVNAAAGFGFYAAAFDAAKQAAPPRGNPR